jgi:hypothetical protein
VNLSVLESVPITFHVCYINLIENVLKVEFLHYLSSRSDPGYGLDAMMTQRGFASAGGHKHFAGLNKVWL